MKTTSARYGFYEKVIVSTSAPEKQEVNGETGAVNGRAENESGEWFYSVTIYRSGAGWHFREDELLPTGEFDEREIFYDGARIRVRVDRQGHGTIAESDPDDMSSD